MKKSRCDAACVSAYSRDINLKWELFKEFVLLRFLFKQATWPFLLLPITVYILGGTRKRCERTQQQRTIFRSSLVITTKQSQHFPSSISIYELETRGKKANNKKQGGREDAFPFQTERNLETWSSRKVKELRNISRFLGNGMGIFFANAFFQRATFHPTRFFVKVMQGLINLPILQTDRRLSISWKELSKDFWFRFSRSPSNFVH